MAVGGTDSRSDAFSQVDRTIMTTTLRMPARPLPDRPGLHRAIPSRRSSPYPALPSHPNPYPTSHVRPGATHARQSVSVHSESDPTDQSVPPPATPDRPVRASTALTCPTSACQPDPDKPRPATSFPTVRPPPSRSDCPLRAITAPPRQSRAHPNPTNRSRPNQAESSRLPNVEDPKEMTRG